MEQAVLTYTTKYIKRKLCLGYIPCAGRNFLGRICVRHKGGGAKRKFQNVDFYRRINSFGSVRRIYKTTFRTALLGLIIYANGFSGYVTLTHNIFLNDVFYSGSFMIEDLVLHNGVTLPIGYTNLFSVVHNIEAKPYAGIKLVRAAGTRAIISLKGKKDVTIKSSNGFVSVVSKYCICSLGLTSNPMHKNHCIGKAGTNRLLGVRPTVRGVAMNPHDHPHGGGEGKKSPPVGARSP